MRFHKTIHKNGLTGIQYPVGKNIHAAIKASKVMADTLQDIYRDANIRLTCAGSSGAIFASLVAAEMPNQILEILHIKKPRETSHEPGDRANFLFSEKVFNIIIDDWISTGATI